MIGKRGWVMLLSDLEVHNLKAKVLAAVVYEIRFKFLVY
jgi:hypothetical protein